MNLILATVNAIMDAGVMPAQEIVTALLNIVLNVSSEDIKVAIYLALKITVKTDAGKLFGSQELTTKKFFRLLVIA